eukprot:Blabericola_migrator_1__1011@NODE_1254_length_4974_cov_113_661300_g647_i1_p5_GENE_NODE_1254_length_4974_cov_113_661300_g647_i1NODE_1254_length_4974_cov_113_661300_g647_i1_p5_ORF_typecomplete_len155_score9_75Glyco_hydro_19/PF00182_19/0_0062Hepar_II_III_N/PF16889_5/0_17_NODE_1254_length_4974_cov_113_661300_g647_i16991163
MHTSRMLLMMRSVVFLATTLLRADAQACPSPDKLTPLQDSKTGEGKTGLARVLSEEAYNQIFIGRTTLAGICDGAQLFTYEGLVSAATVFPEFANSGDWYTDALEVASFLAMHSQETTGGWSGAPCGQAYGGCFAREQTCYPKNCPAYSRWERD